MITALGIFIMATTALFGFSASEVRGKGVSAVIIIGLYVLGSIGNMYIAFRCFEGQ